MASAMERMTVVSVELITGMTNAGDIEFVLDEITDCTISNAEEVSDITGKQGRLISRLKRNKTCTITGTSGLISGGLMKAQVGSEEDISADSAMTVFQYEPLTVSSTHTVTISGTPANTGGTEIFAVYEVMSDGSLGTKYTQSAEAGDGKFTYTDKVITLPDTVDEGTAINVWYEATVEGRKITNLSDNYSKTLKVIVDVMVKDHCDNIYRGQFIFPRADVSGNFDLAMGSDATTHPFELQSLASTCRENGFGNGELWTYFVFE